MNDEWRLIIEIMDYNSIKEFSKTNKLFRDYIIDNSEYIYKKLLERDYKCINGYKELYKLLEVSKAKYTKSYKKKCLKEGIFECENLIKEFNLFFQNNENITLNVFMNISNSIINCLNFNKCRQILKNDFLNLFVDKLEEVNTKINQNPDPTDKYEIIWRKWYPLIIEKFLTIYTPSQK